MTVTNHTMELAKWEGAATLLHDLDEAWLTFSKDEVYADVFLVFGNSGWDVVCDYELVPGFEEEVMNAVNEYAETFA